jgi:cation diffusion facilitator CzcD-associated flavoprotein CzcO
MTPEWDVLIIGSGFSGLAMARQLQCQGQLRFQILEQGERLGGTWRDNRYPGCACDVPSHLYSLSSAPKIQWRRHYADHDEIWRYLEEISQPLQPHLRLGACMTTAQYDTHENMWKVILQSGEMLTTRILVAGLGPLTRPSLPSIPGLALFKGPAFHSALWPAHADLQGKRVAVVGTGASAIQIVPAIAPQVAQLTVFQRSAPWVVAKHDHAYSPWAQWCFRFIPGWRWLYRTRLYMSRELVGLAFIFPRLMRVAEGMARRSLHRQVRDVQLRNQLTPHTPMGCKRIMLSDDYYAALQRPNVTLVTSPIEQITAQGMMSADGVCHPVDTIIWATGFFHTQTPERPVITGDRGQTLKEMWQTRRGAYNGSVMAGFPNLFLLTGPNSGLGHNSIVFMIEAQVHWVMQALRVMNQQGAQSLVLRPEAYDHHIVEMEQRSRNTVWKSGCKSWYLDEQGYNTALWPGLSLEFWWRTRRFKKQDFILR